MSLISREKAITVLARVISEVTAKEYDIKGDAKI